MKFLNFILAPRLPMTFEPLSHSAIDSITVGRSEFASSLGGGVHEHIRDQARPTIVWASEKHRTLMLRTIEGIEITCVEEAVATFARRGANVATT